MATPIGKVFNRSIVLSKGADIWSASTKVFDSSTQSFVGDIQASAASITRTELSSAAGSKFVQTVTATQGTTGAVYIDVFAPEAGTIAGITLNAVDALAASDTNYITWTVTNRGQAGAGSLVVLAATAANTTKTTGGAALSANTNRSLTLSSTTADVTVAAGDIIRITSTATGTLANTVTLPKYMVKFAGTT